MRAHAEQRRLRFTDLCHAQEVGGERLTDIQRIEPKQELFVMPAGYEYRHGGKLTWESPEAELRRLTAK